MKILQSKIQYISKYSLLKLIKITGKLTNLKKELYKEQLK